MAEALFFTNDLPKGNCGFSSEVIYFLSVAGSINQTSNYEELCTVEPEPEAEDNINLFCNLQFKIMTVKSLLVGHSFRFVSIRIYCSFYHRFLKLFYRKFLSDKQFLLTVIFYLKIILNFQLIFFLRFQH